MVQHLPIGHMSDADIERFLGFVERRGDDECWPWLGTCTKGRGHFSLHGKTFIAPRIAHYLAMGVDLGDRLACHTRNCNNPTCCNPRHIYPGTRQDDTRDRLACGHQARGERHGLAKLTDDKVAEIRRRYATGLITQDALGREYGVSQATISEIVNYETWTQVPAASSTDAFATTLPTPLPVTVEGFDSPVDELADCASSPAASNRDSITSADLPNEPQATADERRQFLNPVAQEEQRIGCPYQVAG